MNFVDTECNISEKERVLDLDLKGEVSDPNLWVGDDVPNSAQIRMDEDGMVVGPIESLLPTRLLAFKRNEKDEIDRTLLTGLIMAVSKPRKLWTPSSEDGQNIKRFIALANERHSINLKTYDELHQWSTDAESAEQFWLLLFDFLEIKSNHKPTKATKRDHVVTIPEMLIRRKCH